MAKKNMSEKSLNNLKKGESTRFCGDGAVIAQAKSVEARKKYRPLREIAKEKLDEETWNKLLAAMIERAGRGDPKAFELLRDTIGEKPTDKLELQGTQDLAVNINIVE